MRHRPSAMGDQPVTGQGGATEHAFMHTKVHPALLPINLRAADKAKVGPLIHQGANVVGVHGAISKQVVIKLNPATNQMGMVL